MVPSLFYCHDWAHAHSDKSSDDFEDKWAAIEDVYSLIKSNLLLAEPIAMAVFEKTHEQGQSIDELRSKGFDLEPHYPQSPPFANRILDGYYNIKKCNQKRFN